jgi:hypothetical protein
MLHQSYIVASLLFLISGILLCAFSPYELYNIRSSETTVTVAQIIFGIACFLISIVCIIGFFLEYRFRGHNPSKTQLRIISVLSGLFQIYCGLPFLRLLFLLSACFTYSEHNRYFTQIFFSNSIVFLLNVGILIYLYCAKRAFSKKYPQYSTLAIRDFGANFGIVFFTAFLIISVMSLLSTMSIGSLQHIPFGPFFFVLLVTLIIPASGLPIVIFLLIYLAFLLLRVINGFLVFSRTTASPQQTPRPPLPNRPLSVTVLVFVMVVETGSIVFVVFLLFSTLLSSVFLSGQQSNQGLFIYIAYTAISTAIHLKLAMDLVSASKTDRSDRKAGGRASNAGVQQMPSVAQPVCASVSGQPNSPAATHPAGIVMQGLRLQSFPAQYQPITGQQIVCVFPAQPTYGSTVPISSYSLPPAFSVEMQPFPSVDSEKNLKE